MALATVGLQGDIYNWLGSIQKFGRPVGVIPPETFSKAHY